MQKADTYKKKVKQVPDNKPVSPVNGQPTPRGKPFTSETAREARQKRAKEERAQKGLKEALIAVLTEGNNYMELAKAAVEMARKNPKYWELIRDTIGEKPKDSMNLTHAYADNFEIVIDDAED